MAGIPSGRSCCICVPLETLEQTVLLIINGNIRNWRYDHISGKLARR